MEIPTMTLRDYLAGQALAGFLAAPPDTVSQDEGPNARAMPYYAAKLAYMYADAMLAVRELSTPEAQP